MFQSGRPELCIIPTKTDNISYPIPVSSLEPNGSFFYRSGPEEGFVVTQDDSGALVLEAIPPSTFFLSPAHPLQPGYQAFKVKLLSYQESYRMYYLRDQRGWVEWTMGAVVR
jgi:hypothetical protein